MQTRRFTQQMHTILSLPVLKIPHIYCIRPQSITLIQSYGMTSEDMEHGLRCMKHFHAINNSAFELFTRKYRFGTAWGQVNGHMITLINVKCHWITPSEGSVGRLRVTRCIAVVVPCINHTHQSSQVTVSHLITGVITYNVTCFGYDTNKEILLCSKA